jgi:hypothetical protein
MQRRKWQACRNDEATERLTSVDLLAKCKRTLANRCGEHRVAAIGVGGADQRTIPSFPDGRAPNPLIRFEEEIDQE